MRKVWILIDSQIALNGNLQNVRISVYRNKRNGKLKTVQELWVPGK